MSFHAQSLVAISTIWSAQLIPRVPRRAWKSCRSHGLHSCPCLLHVSISLPKKRCMSRGASTQGERMTKELSIESTCWELNNCISPMSNAKHTYAPTKTGDHPHPSRLRRIEGRQSVRSNGLQTQPSSLLPFRPSPVVSCWPW